MKPELVLLFIGATVLIHRSEGPTETKAQAVYFTDERTFRDERLHSERTKSTSARNPFPGLCSRFHRLAHPTSAPHPAPRAPAQDVDVVHSEMVSVEGQRTKRLRGITFREDRIHESPTPIRWT